MKHFKNILFGVALVFTIGLVGCRTAPMYDVEQSPIDVSAKTTLKDIKKIIKRSGASYGWRMKEKEPGVITGLLNVRKHMVEIEIPYSKTSYSIHYKDSSGMKYDASSSTINKQYNKWVQNLDRAIQTNLYSM
ncbi:MAG: hypothetical protein ABFS39_12650 [Pseudomonadota bacterium]